MAVASLVLGIISIPFCYLFIPAILAVVFGAVALNRCKQNPLVGGRGKAIAGLIMGAVSLGFIVLALLFGDATLDVDSAVALLR